MRYLKIQRGQHVRFALAKEVTKVAAEHPEWMNSQMVAEAKRRMREWQKHHRRTPPPVASPGRACPPLDTNILDPAPRNG